MSKPVILVCEDELDSQKALADALTKSNFEVYVASDGLQAVQLAKEIKPQVILLDIRMPKIDGIEAAQKIRVFNEEVKIILLTAFQGQELVKEAAKYDICAYIEKPSSVQQVIKTIQSALGL